MSHYSRMRGTALAALIAIGGLGIEGCATAQSAADGRANVAPAATVASAPAVAAAPAASAPVSTPVASSESTPTSTAMASASTADEAADSQGDVVQLQRLMHDNELSELRTAYNGTYGASLLLHGKDMTYYAVLFQQKNFWRVIKTTNEDYAESVYADFVRRSSQLADVEIKRTVLAAQKVYTEAQLAKAQARADRLQADLDVARKQQALVATRQKEARDEAASLQTQKVAAQEQLDAMQQQIHLLQRETEQGLPSTYSHSHKRSRHRKQ
ncbi:DUF2968 domain-containing protein [Trinickia dinghuensis]|uniref:DUF2968 domain-containing protein n=1 Tax=Trinickia dinghuensis TaxID=2291023 RepID=A0A3D8JX31_9BURK|nr:DUF2968 domain-containing protein [Trinickia dinghuensis]RDU97362.1 DUF2968 domain-containing protein [Trinickia dinghuensis]